MEEKKKKSGVRSLQGRKESNNCRASGASPSPARDVRGLPQGSAWPGVHTHTDPPGAPPALAPTPQQQLRYPKTASALNKKASWTPTAAAATPGVIWQSSIGVAPGVISQQMKAEGV